jgi:PAS domain S-box-containing protein
MQLAFWQELGTPTPDLLHLQQLASQITGAMSCAQEAFGALLQLNPSSPDVLRMWASFLCDVGNQPDRGATLLRRADEIEDMKSKSTHGPDSDGTLLDDRSSVISVCGSRARLGEIIQANTGAVRLFGFSRAELLGQNIRRIVPPPYAASHDQYLLRYIEHGSSNNKLLDQQRYLFGLHKNGFLIPIDILIREVSGSVAGSDNKVQLFSAFACTQYLYYLCILPRFCICSCHLCSLPQSYAQI